VPLIRTLSLVRPLSSGTTGAKCQLPSTLFLDEVNAVRIIERIQQRATGLESEILLLERFRLRRWIPNWTLRMIVADFKVNRFEGTVRKDSQF
jgi:hypothetical protein